MQLAIAEKLAKEMMAKYKLDDYRFEFDNSKTRFGRCNNTYKLISLSKELVKLNSEEQVTDTILHEIAHALTPHCNHNEVWRRVARAIGANGLRCYDDNVVETPMHKWSGICSKCGHKVKRHVRRKNLCCGTCYREGGTMNRISWKKNY